MKNQKGILNLVHSKKALTVYVIVGLIYSVIRDKRSRTIYIRRPGQLSYIWRGRYQVLSDTSCSDIFVFASAFGFGPACINVI